MVLDNKLSEYNGLEKIKELESILSEKMVVYAPSYSKTEIRNAEISLIQFYNDSDKELRGKSGRLLGYSKLRRRIHEWWFK